MKYLFLLVLFALSLFQSCAVEKRRYMSGWHISTKKIKRSHTPKRDIENHPDQEVTFHAAENNQLDVLNFMLVEEHSSTDIGHSESTLIDAREIQTVIVESEKTDNAVQEIGHETFANSVKREKTSSFFRKTKTNMKRRPLWIPKMWGGILGVLLALIAIPVLFLIELGSLSDFTGEDVLQMSEDRDDRPFVHAFKVSFNTVYRIGIVTLAILTMIVAIVFLVAFLYLEFGFLGVLLALLIVFLIMLLLAFLGAKLVDWMLPDYP